MAIHGKTIIVVTVIVAAAIGAVALLLPVLGNPDRYRPEVISYLEAKTGKQIEVGHIGVNWIPPSIRLDNFGARNPKLFPSGYLLKVARMDATIDATALHSGALNATWHRIENHVARGTTIQPGGNGSQTTTDRGAPQQLVR